MLSFSSSFWFRPLPFSVFLLSFSLILHSIVCEMMDEHFFFHHFVVSEWFRCLNAQIRELECDIYCTLLRFFLLGPFSAPNKMPNRGMKVGKKENRGKGKGETRAGSPSSFSSLFDLVRTKVSNEHCLGMEIKWTDVTARKVVDGAMRDAKGTQDERDKVGCRSVS